jgi:hypothetical protein
MRGKQAKILSDGNLEDLLLFAETSRHPLRNKVTQSVGPVIVSERGAGQ